MLEDNLWLTESGRLKESRRLHEDSRLKRKTRQAAAGNQTTKTKLQQAEVASSETSLQNQPNVPLVDFIHPLESGLNRRAFLKTSAAISLLGALPACKPSAPDPKSGTVLVDNAAVFTEAERASLDAVFQQLFPDDGNGPSSQAIRALDYLAWALSDPSNIDDGDPEFIRKGVGWLNDLANQTQGDRFERLNLAQQDQILQQIARSSAGENWLSLLMYYLMEALLLDPVYGGNTNEIGWQWLEHQAGYPRPTLGKTYRDFE